MAKGKYGRAAAVRREAAQIEADLDMYQKRIRELTAERKALRSKLAAEQKARRDETKVLRAQRDAGWSPTIQVIQDENARLRTENDRLTRAAKEARRQHDSQFKRLTDHFRDAHKLIGADAAEAAVGILYPALEGQTITDLPVGKNTRALSVERIRQLEWQHGIRGVRQ